MRGILPEGVTVAYIRQSEPLGLGHAVLCAKQLVGDEPFAILLADDLINFSEKPCLKQMVEVFNERQASVLAVERVDPLETHRYGIVEIEGDRIGTITNIVEKPDPKDAPSNLAVVGRYILTPAIFALLENTAPGKGNEIQLTDAIDALRASEAVHTLEFDGRRFDCGSKLGYLEATVAFALAHKELGAEFKSVLENYR